MKKSTALILIAPLVIIGCIISYNFRLKAMYDSKSYKDRFYNMDRTDFQGISTLDLKSANKIGIQVEYGTQEGLWVPKNLKNNIKVSVNGSELSLDYVRKNKSDKVMFGTNMILITKDLRRLTATHADTKIDASFARSQVRLKGFKQSKLHLQVAADTKFYFDDMQVDTLNAKIGGDEYAGKAELTLPFNSTINEANLDIGINGEVNLQGAKVLKTKSSRVIVNP